MGQTPRVVPHGFDARRGLDTAQRPETAMANNTWNARRAPSPPAARATPDPRAAAPDISQRAQQQPPRNPDATTPLPITPEAANPLITLHMPRLEDINSQVDDDNDDNSDGGALPREEDPEGQGRTPWEGKSTHRIFAKLHQRQHRPCSQEDGIWAQTIQRALLTRRWGTHLRTSIASFWIGSSCLASSVWGC
eukprot:CAMPEP_0206633412 /NCGR_PEP_ID=MMETSP0325_2-20121206/69473_1 /ASSEMBLY_ACC=CAM_ASM_000347 /TAXON_ID=2866 /ORGANISM="Crypthecodinium cohnii, Strain Seligo" /LENGTH=192 /DNA_ID=CAMNT_0054159097 /DNA_START=123 /DNA_END=701 /DNA_ORIENTATION=-